MLSLKDCAISLSNHGIWTIVDPTETYLTCALKITDTNSGFSRVRFGRSVCIALLEEVPFSVLDAMFIKKTSSGWTYHNNPVEVLGAENLDYISDTCADLEEVYRLCRGYYCESPVHIKGWPVPIYQQPRWNAKKIEVAITNAKSENFQTALQTIARKRERALRGDYEGNDATHLVYYPIAKDGSEPRSAIERNATQILFLRYDLGGALIADPHAK